MGLYLCHRAATNAEAGRHLRARVLERRKLLAARPNLTGRPRVVPRQRLQRERTLEFISCMYSGS